MDSSSPLAALLTVLNSAPSPRASEQLREWRCAVASRALQLQSVRLPLLPLHSKQRAYMRDRVTAMFAAARELPTITATVTHPAWEVSAEYMVELIDGAPVERLRCCPTCREFFPMTTARQWHCKPACYEKGRQARPRRVPGKRRVSTVLPVSLPFAIPLNACMLTCMQIQEVATAIPRYISPQRLAAQLGVSLPTIWRMRQRGELPEPTRVSPNRVAWTEPQILAFLSERATLPPRGPMQPKDRAKPAVAPRSKKRGRQARKR